MNTPHIPDCIPTRNYGVLHSAAKKILAWCGWTINGELPIQPKLIVAVAPHTSNWDFFIGIAVMFSLQLKVSFLGKASIFRWPVKSILTAIGGIAVDRNNSHGVVGQIVQEVARNDKFILGLAPEGTRSKTTEWKTGFLHIAKQANIPIVPVSFDFAKKEIFLHPAVYISRDIKQELIDFKQVFANVCAKNPQAV
jgi:1-acyl-sn-glycerol-3-phosphate acyltransferase